MSSMRWSSVVLASARARDPVEPAHRAHPVFRAVPVDEGEDLRLRPAQNWMAFFNRACSPCRIACARSSSRRRWSSATVFVWSLTAFPATMRPSRYSLRHRESMKG